MNITADSVTACADDFFYADKRDMSDNTASERVQLSMFDKFDAVLYPDVYTWEADFAARTISRTAMPGGTGKSLSFSQFIESLNENDIEELKKKFELKGQEQRRMVETSVRFKKSGERRYIIRGMVFRCADGGVFAAGAACDAENSSMKNDYLKYLITHDELTGLNNLKALDSLDKSADCLYPYSIVIACIDNLREINDSLGYSAGNDLIKNVAGVVKECFGDSDHTVRLGGGEFCAVFSGKDALEIELKIKEANMMIHKMYLNLIKTEVSFGYAISGESSDLYSLYGEAAARMRRDRSLKKILSGESVIDSLNDIINARAGWGARAKRLQGLAALIGAEMGCGDAQTGEIKALAKIADIGHISLSDSAVSGRDGLDKKGAAEYLKHVEAGRSLISQIGELSDMENLYLDVYKRYDEWQEGISLSARIVAGAIGFDNISLSGNVRIKSIIAAMEAEKGARYCPKVVDAITKITNKHLLVQYRALI